MHGRLHVQWLSSELQSAERCVISPGSRHTTIEGTVVLPFGGVPGRIDYTISTTPTWITRSVTIELVAGEERRVITLEHADRWLVNGAERPDLGSCIDVDLGWTPATNILPLRRSPIDIGQSFRTIAAWVRYPELDVVPSRQTYTRLSEYVVRYQSETFEADLEVTADGLVTKYGDGLWRAERVSRTR